MINVTINSNSGRVTKIVPETTSIAKVLADAKVNTFGTVVNLNGSPLNEAAMAMSFADRGITTGTAYLNTVVKTENAVQVRIMGNAVVVASDMTYDQIEKLEKYRPDALVKVDEKKNPLFAIATSGDAEGSLDEYGACYGTAATADGKATITMCLPDGVAEPKKWVADTYGKALKYVKAIEDTLADQLTAVAADEAEIMSVIESV